MHYLIAWYLQHKLQVTIAIYGEKNQLPSPRSSVKPEASGWEIVEG